MHFRSGLFGRTQPRAVQVDARDGGRWGWLPSEPFWACVVCSGVRDDVREVAGHADQGEKFVGGSESRGEQRCFLVPQPLRAHHPLPRRTTNAADETEKGDKKSPVQWNVWFPGKANLFLAVSPVTCIAMFVSLLTCRRKIFVCT